MKNLCFGCMRQKENSPICEHCGFDERSQNQPHQLSVGTLLQNQYLVGKVLGQGGFGITYIGWDQHLSIPVAIKEYYPGGVVQRNTRWSTNVMCSTGEAPEVFEKHKNRFLTEARTLAQLSGIPEIVQIRNFFRENDTAYIIMEYVEGITLKDHLKSLGRPMTESEALAIMEPVLKALQKVHDHGLIHRDISPDNIMLPRSGGIRLIDFGTVRYVDDSGNSKSTEAILKPGFAPMEQYNSRGNLGTWTDVYAICATFHYLLTGKVPADVHERLEQGESLPLLHSQSGISQNLIEVLEMGMKVRTVTRLQTIEELHKLLYSDKKVHTQIPKAAVPEAPPLQRKKKSKIRSVLIWGICAAISIAALTPKIILPFAKYQYALFQMDAGRYQEAIIIFNSLGDYQDAKQNILVCQEGIQETAYQEAVALMEQEAYGEALSILLGMEKYKDCSKLIATCLELSVEERYKYAVELMNSGKYADARDLFNTMIHYQNSQALLEECDQKILEAKKQLAAKQLNGKNYSAALLLFKELQAAGMDVSEQIHTCEIQILESNQSPFVTSGKPTGWETSLWGNTRGNAKLHSLTRVTLDNGCVRFTLDCTAPKCSYISIFNPPDGAYFMYQNRNISEGRQTIVFDVTLEDIQAAEELTIMFGDPNGSIIFFQNPY